MGNVTRFPLAWRTPPAIPDYASGTTRPALREPSEREHDLRKRWWNAQASAWSWTRRTGRTLAIARRARATAIRNGVIGALGWFLAGIFGLALWLVG